MYNTVSKTIMFYTFLEFIRDAWDWLCLLTLIVKYSIILTIIMTILILITIIRIRIKS